MKSHWKTIDTVPKREEVLLYCPDLHMQRKVMIGISHPLDGEVCYYAEGLQVEPTHWMPLPEAP
jgi:hypothetical protein